eukprot:TRINITY_DN8743_c0_g2_i1.p1 TRINITY_DN8743_c0_g2~~TRINITY_DN8743_c0_g2_i1.p1  ORF type:complete len:189 (-),score=18.86 TRINITY_DN8743_c0_g2_i1:82-648(-)
MSFEHSLFDKDAFHEDFPIASPEGNREASKEHVDKELANNTLEDYYFPNQATPRTGSRSHYVLDQASSLFSDDKWNSTDTPGFQASQSPQRCSDTFEYQTQSATIWVMREIVDSTGDYSAATEIALKLLEKGKPEIQGPNDRSPAVSELLPNSLSIQKIDKPYGRLRRKRRRIRGNKRYRKDNLNLSA